MSDKESIEEGACYYGDDTPKEYITDQYGARHYFDPDDAPKCENCLLVAPLLHCTLEGMDICEDCVDSDVCRDCGNNACPLKTDANPYKMKEGQK